MTDRVDIVERLRACATFFVESGQFGSAYLEAAAEVERLRRSPSVEAVEAAKRILRWYEKGPLSRSEQSTRTLQYEVDAPIVARALLDGREWREFPGAMTCHTCALLELPNR